MWRELWEAYRGRILGIAAGLLFVQIYLFSGFWDMLFCALLLGVCYWIGKQKDDGKGPLIPWERLTDWVTDRWPWSR